MATRYRASAASPTPSAKIPANSIRPAAPAVPAPTANTQSNLASAAPVAVNQAKAQAAAADAANVMSIDNQVGAARNFAGSLQDQGESIFSSQQANAQGFGRTGQNFSATGQSITAPGGLAGAAAASNGGLGGAGRSSGTQFDAGYMGQLVNNGKINNGPLGAPPAGPPAFGVGKQVTGGNMGAVSTVNPSQLGGYGSVAGGLGAAPGAVSLGAGPQVGSVGNIGTGAAPGAVAGSFGNMGGQSGDQQSMMARLNGFLDGPEGPSVAEAQLREAQATNMGQMIGMARSGRGGAGAQAQALEGAIGEGGAVASQTAGQMATLRAQEADMLKNRQLSAIGLGGEMSTAARGQDLSFRGQNLQAAQGDQSTSLGARGQDLSASMANQSTQTQLEQLRANTALGARGQDLSAMQGNQSTALGARGQDLGALTSDQGADITARGQNLGALQGNQQAELGARGQNIQQEANVLGTNTALRGQDLSALTSDADRNLAAQQLQANTQLGYGALQNQAQGMGLNYLSQSNQQALMGEGMAQDAINQNASNLTSINNTNTMADAGIQQQAMQNAAQPSFWERMALAGVSSAGQAGGGLLANPALMSDVRAKTDISPLDDIGDHLRGAPGYRYRYKPGLGEDHEIEHAGPMAQDLERGPFGRALVKKGPDGYRRVDTARLSLVNHAGLASMRGELDRIKAMLDEAA